MKRLPAILAVLLGLSAPAMAQSLSLDQAIDEPTLIRLSVSDAPKLDRSAVLDRIAKMTVMMRDPFGRESTLDIEKSDNGLQGR